MTYMDDIKALPGDSGTDESIFKSALRVESGDASGSTSTTAVMGVGDQFSGTIGGSGDHDFIRINLTAGQTYVFTVWGRGGSSAGLSDSVLTLRDSNGRTITGNDDVEPGSNTFSAVTFTASSSGTYYLDVSGYGTHTGNYTVQAATNVYNLDQVVSQLAQFGWGIPAVIRHDERPGDTMTVNIDGLTSAGQQLAAWALQAWSTAMGIDFVRSSSTAADIIFDDNAAGASAGPSSYNPLSGVITQSRVNISTSWLSSYGTSIDSYSFLTYLHEIGHALGLGHAGPYDGSAVYSRDALFRNDSYQLTVMSYFDQDDNPFINASRANPITPMIGDIAAINAMYGNPGAVHSGNTVWGANSNVGGYLGTIFNYIFNGASANPSIYAGGPVAFTIQDSGGTDTLNFGTINGNQRINLNPEGISNTAGRSGGVVLTGNLVIARGTIIENVITGSGNDTIFGNSVNNVITAGRGNDLVYGGGGTGDRAVINDSMSSVSATALSGGGVRIVSADGTDSYYGVELFTFSNGTFRFDGSGFVAATTGGSGTINGTPDVDNLIGTSGDDRIYAYEDDDRVDAGAGNDTVYGGDGDDGILGRSGNDTLFGDLGNDNIAASDGNDVVYGGSGNDALGGGNGNDRMYGGSGNDTIGSGNNTDLIYAGTGDDVASGGWGTDQVYGGDGDDQLAGSYDDDRVYGGEGNDDMGGGTGTDYMYGGIGNDQLGAGDDNDFLWGEAGNDFLGGGAGNDVLRGGGGRDKLNGGTGNDHLEGGTSADIFVFNRFVNGERDAIVDFENGLDRLQMHGVAGGFGALSIATVAGGVEIRYAGHTIMMNGISSGQIDASDFIFV